MQKLWHLLTVPLAFVATDGHADLTECRWGEDRTVTVIDRSVRVTQGRDESLHSAEVEIWGPERISVSCQNVDADPEHELIISSRGIGSGPYYRLQIVDFAEAGILAWSYHSDGVPRVESRQIFLGSLEGRYAEAGAQPVYSEHVYLASEGLVNTGMATRWMLFLTFERDGEEVSLLTGEHRSEEACAFDGESTLNRLEQVGLAPTFSCMSNVEIQEALDAITN